MLCVSAIGRRQWLQLRGWWLCRLRPLPPYYCVRNRSDVVVVVDGDEPLLFPPLIPVQISFGLNFGFPKKLRLPQLVLAVPHLFTPSKTLFVSERRVHSTGHARSWTSFDICNPLIIVSEGFGILVSYPVPCFTLSPSVVHSLTAKSCAITRSQATNSTAPSRRRRIPNFLSTRQRCLYRKRSMLVVC